MQSEDDARREKERERRRRMAWVEKVQGPQVTNGRLWCRIGLTGEITHDDRVVH